MFTQKWHWTLAAVVVFCSGGTAFFLKSKMEPQDPIKTYKSRNTRPKNEFNKGNQHGKSGHHHAGQPWAFSRAPP